jgi:hypothetical protein
MKRLIVVLVAVLILVLADVSRAVTINFDDVVGSSVDVTTRYTSLGVTLNAIDNPFPLSGPYPAPPTLPPVRGGATTWTFNFGSATSPPQVGIAASTSLTGDPGDGGILISFAFDVESVSLVGNDLGGLSFGDDESVTLTAYNAAGNRIGQVYSTVNIPSANLYDQTPASISMPGIRYVAFNYTDTEFGFYAIDDLNFTPAGAVPETTASFGLLALGLFSLCGVGRFLGRDQAS